MQLSEWLSYISTIHRNEIELGLTRVKAVAEKLPIFPLDSFVMTVGGTNGKGSCVAVLDAILRAAGYRVAKYTSPHLLTFNERICLQGQPVTDKLLCEAFAQVEAARNDISLTFFEYFTLAALLIFKQQQPDVIILEVGLGGRLDAVNIVDAGIAVITTIALDHVERLGPDRESIGFEKAGIFRTGQLAVCGDFEPPASLLAAAERLKTKLFTINSDFGYNVFKNDWQWWNTSTNYEHLPFPQLELQNVAAALQALALLPRSLAVSEATIKKVLPQLALAGRFQVIPGKVNYIFDVAHNPAGAQLLANQLKKQHCEGKTYAIMGMLNDKDHTQTLAPLIGLVERWFLTDLTVPRGYAAKELAAKLQLLTAANISLHASPHEAYEAIKPLTLEGDRVVVFGSFHTVGEILTRFFCP